MTTQRRRAVLGFSFIYFRYNCALKLQMSQYICIWEKYMNQLIICHLSREGYNSENNGTIGDAWRIRGTAVTRCQCRVRTLYSSHADTRHRSQYRVVACNKWIGYILYKENIACVSNTDVVQNGASSIYTSTALCGYIVFIWFRIKYKQSLKNPEPVNYVSELGHCAFYGAQTPSSNCETSLVLWKIPTPHIIKSGTVSLTNTMPVQKVDTHNLWCTMIRCYTVISASDCHFICYTVTSDPLRHINITYVNKTNERDVCAKCSLNAHTHTHTHYIYIYIYKHSYPW